MAAHAATFAELGGVPAQLLYDRMKTVVVGEPRARRDSLSSHLAGPGCPLRLSSQSLSTLPGQDQGQGGLQHQRMFRRDMQRLAAFAGQAQAQGLAQLEAPAQAQGAAPVGGHLNTAVGGEQAAGPGHVQAVGPFGFDPALGGLSRPLRQARGGLLLP